MLRTTRTPHSDLDRSPASVGVGPCTAPSNMDAHMIHGNAHDDRFCGPVTAQTPTMTTNTMHTKHMQPDLATQAQAEPWQSLAEQRPRQCASAAATAPTSNDRFPGRLKRLQEPSRSRPARRVMPIELGLLPAARTSTGRSVQLLRYMRRDGGAAHLLMASRSKPCRP